MIANIGTPDRIIRIVIGALLVIWSLFGLGHGGFWPWVELIVGLILLATAATRFCPIWRALGIDTRAKKS